MNDDLYVYVVIYKIIRFGFSQGFVFNLLVILLFIIFFVFESH